MEQKDFSACIKILHDEYGRQYGNTAARLAWEKLKDCSAKAMFRGVEQSILNSSSFLPDIQKVINSVLAIDAEIKKEEYLKRENETAREKGIITNQTERAFSSNSEIAKDTMLVVNALLSGKITRGHALDGIRHLHAKYPGAGFAIEGSKLQNYYDKRDMDLKKMPGNKVY